jgi:hypothetical protein
MSDQLRTLDGTEIFGDVGHRIAQALMVERVAAHQLQLQALVGSPEQCATLVQCVLLLQALADGV